MLQGCVATPDARKDLSMHDSDPALVRLASSAMNVTKHWNDIAEIESAQYQRENGGTLYSYDPRFIPGLDRYISLGDEWSGPIEPLIKEVAALSGYDIRVLGVKPAADILVNIDTSYRRAIDILADAGYQGGKRIAVRILAKSSVIEIEYAKY
ncbi:MAG: DotD/TraH family lipoprotein [Pseudomonadota bacterium]